jgi:hypothetical protein
MAEHHFELFVGRFTFLDADKRCRHAPP